MAENIVFVDGLWGCGKTLFSPIISSFERIELMTYCYEIEHACSLYFLEKMSLDGAAEFIKLNTDTKIYHGMMGREVNFRPSDLSSIFKSIDPNKYLKRIFQDGDEAIPARLVEEKPILHLVTHNMLAFSAPIFSALDSRVSFVEVVRHPLYMLKQQYLNFERMIGDIRDLNVNFYHSGIEVPYFAKNWAELYVKSNPMDKAIYYTVNVWKQTMEMLKTVPNKQVLVIPFEKFALNPEGFMPQLETILQTKQSQLTSAMLQQQNVPRKKVSQGIELDIYKRCGWEPSKDELSERQELDLRFEYVKSLASPAAIKELETLIDIYENNYWKP